jgi:hypothetical protein
VLLFFFASIRQDGVMRRITRTHLCVAALLLSSLPILAEAALYKCVDEKTKAVTYSGTACVSGNENKVSITENAIMDGAVARREIARRKQIAIQEAQAMQHVAPGPTTPTPATPTPVGPCYNNKVFQVDSSRPSGGFPPCFTKGPDGKWLN